MWDCFSKNVQQVLVRAQVEAQKNGADFIGSEHLMLGLLGNRHNTACRVLRLLGADISGLQQMMEEGARKKESKGFSDFPFSARATRIIEIAYAISQTMEKTTVGSEHVLLGILREGNGSASRILMEKFSVDFSTVLEKLYGISSLKLDNLTQARAVVENSLQLLEESCATSVIQQKLHLGKVDELIKLLDYAGDLLTSLDRQDLARKTASLSKKITNIKPPDLECTENDTPAPAMREITEKIRRIEGLTQSTIPAGILKNQAASRVCSAKGIRVEITIEPGVIERAVQTAVTRAMKNKKSGR